MRLGIIGAGMIVKEVLPELVQIEGLEVVAIQARRLEQVREVADANGVPNAVTSFEDLLACDIDTVYVAVPNAFHYEYCRQALEAGLNVVVEKPMCSNAREAHELAELAHDKGAFLFEAITAAHLPTFDKVREWLPRIGTVKLLIANFSQYSSRYDAFRAGKVMPAFDPAAAGGALMDINLYNVHWAIDLFGRPDDLTYFANVERDIDTSGTLVLRYPGFLATCIGAKDCAGPKLFTIQGIDGYLSLDLNPGLVGTAHLRLNDGTQEDYVEEFTGARVVPEFRHFVEIIDSNDHEACDWYLERSLIVADVLTAARKDAGIVFPAD